MNYVLELWRKNSKVEYVVADSLTHEGDNLTLYRDGQTVKRMRISDYQGVTPVPPEEVHPDMLKGVALAKIKNNGPLGDDFFPGSIECSDESEFEWE